MRIIVIDDKPENLASAKQTLIGHELVLVSTHDEATELLKLQPPQKDVRKVYLAEGRPDMENWRAWDKLSREERTPHCVRMEEIRASLTPAPFDAALIDLMMPAGSYTQRDGEHIGQSMSVGYPLALLAALKSGAKYIAVVTATNHHCHPMAATVDHLSTSYWSEKPERCPAAFEINGARTGFFPAPMILTEGTACTRCGGGKQQMNYKRELEMCETCSGTGLGFAKDWGKVLARLMGTG